MRVLEQHTGMTAHQTLLLEMLKDIDIVCKRHRISYGAAVRMKKTNHNLLSNQIASLGLGALLICMPEPVVDANPYFFFAILMLLGGIKGVECSFGKEDTAESERGF